MGIDPQTIHIGRLCERITIQQFTAGQTAAGEETKTWSDLATSISAYVRPMTMRERSSSQQIQAEADTVFIIRHRTDVTPKMRIVYGSKTYDIQSVIDLTRVRDWLVRLEAVAINGGRD